MTKINEELTEDKDILGRSRRRFLQQSGSLAGIALLMNACKKSDTASTTTVTPDPNAPSTNADGSINVGGSDIGILNFAYALEQVESNFYMQVINSQYSGITSSEVAILTQIRDLEVLHREFFKTVLGAKAIPTLTYDFSSINFNDRTAVLTAAKTFEDVGISAYNGSGRLLTDASNLAIAGKLVTLESRNATYIRYLLGETFYSSDMVSATIVDGNGLDLSRKPSEVLPIVKQYLKSTIDISHLPTY